MKSNKIRLHKTNRFFLYSLQINLDILDTYFLNLRTFDVFRLMRLNLNNREFGSVCRDTRSIRYCVKFTNARATSAVFYVQYVCDRTGRIHPTETDD